MPPHFANHVKKHGAMLAKGRLIGVQFEALFTDNLYLEISAHAIAMAERLKTILHEKGCRFFLETATNQQFLIVSSEQLEAWKPHIRYSYWEPFDDAHTVVRLATSWSTKSEEIEALSAWL